MEILYSYGFNAKSTFFVLKNKSISRIDPNTFKEMKNLASLDLEYNDISVIDFSEFGLNNLRSLNLGFNNFTKIKACMFDGLSNLEELYLYRNKITFFEAESWRGLRSFTLVAT